MKDRLIYKYLVWPKGGEMEFFTEDQWDEAKEYATKHGVDIRLV